MINKQIAKELRDKRFKLKEIGDIFGVSKQRVHQVLRNYDTMSHEKSAKIRKELCEICGKKSENIHHIDGNSSNNKQENLLSVCHRCHMDLHKGNNYKSLGTTYVDLICINCGKQIKRPLGEHNDRKRRTKYYPTCGWECTSDYKSKIKD